MSDLTDKVDAVVAGVEAKGRALEAKVLADVRAAAEKFKQLVGFAEHVANNAGDAAVKGADAVVEQTEEDAPAPVAAEEPVDPAPVAPVAVEQAAQVGAPVAEPVQVDAADDASAEDTNQ